MCLTESWYFSLVQRFDKFVLEIIAALLTSISFPQGVGKSAMTIAVCKYITDRELLKDGIYFHRGTGLRNYGSFLSSLKTSLKNSGSNDVSAHLKGLDSSRELEIAISASPSNLQQYPDEEIILNCLVERDLLLVFDEMDDYLQSGADSTARLNRFLVNIFDRAKNTRVLVVSEY